ncbi:hypothetical protein, partial, partial [Absidia glauca]
APPTTDQHVGTKEAPTSNSYHSLVRNLAMAHQQRQDPTCLQVFTQPDQETMATGKALPSSAPDPAF